MTPSSALKAGAAAAVLAIAVALGSGALHPDPAQPGDVSDAGLRQHVTLGVAPAGARCLRTTAKVSADTARLFGLGVPDAAYAYVDTVVAAVPVDSGEPSLPPELDPLVDTQQEVPCRDGGPTIEAWVGDEATFDCACGAGCLRWVAPLRGDAGWQPGVPGLTYSPGQWQATDGGVCVRTACVERAGFPSMDPRCAP